MNRGGGRSRNNSYYRPRGGRSSPDCSSQPHSSGGTDGSSDYVSTGRIGRHTPGQMPRGSYSMHSDHPPRSDNSYQPEHNFQLGIRNPQLNPNSPQCLDRRSEPQDMLSPSSEIVGFPSLSAQSDMGAKDWSAVKSHSGRSLDMVDYVSLSGTEVALSKSSALTQSGTRNEPFEKKKQFGQTSHDKKCSTGKPLNSGYKNFPSLSAQSDPGNNHPSVAKSHIRGPLYMAEEFNNLTLCNTDCTPNTSAVMNIPKEPCQEEKQIGQTSHEKPGSNGRAEKSGNKDNQSISTESARGGKHPSAVKIQWGKILDRQMEVNTLSLRNTEFPHSKPSVLNIQEELSQKEKQLSQIAQEKEGSIERPENSDSVSLEKSFDICPEKPGNLVRLNAPLLMRNREKRNEIRRSKEGREIHILRPGMILLKGYISSSDQVNIVKLCRKLGLGSGGFYQPRYRDGAEIHLKMMCLGMDWDPDTGTYGNMRPSDGAKPPVIPNEFQQLVKGAIEESHGHLQKQKSTSKNVEATLPWMSPNICIINFYGKSGRLGLHQDKDESAESLHRGLPVVSFSVGDSAEFLFGDDRDPEKADKVMLQSGDVLLFGGKSRRVFHGVSTIFADTAPKTLLEATDLRSPGRLNLTFRQF